MKFILFLTFIELRKGDGITKKVLSQKKGFEENGFKCKLGYFEKIDNITYYKIDNEVITKMKDGLIGKIKKFYYLKPLKKWILNNKDNIDFIYMRYNQFSNPVFIQSFKKVKKEGIKLFLEIPTYPYDGELKSNNIRSKLNFIVEKKTRKKFVTNFNNIITFSNDDIIFGKETIKIENGIDLDDINIINESNLKKKDLNLIGVASIAFWHGFDRIIEGLDLYYKNNPEVNVIFNIVGGDENNEEYIKLKNLVKEKELNLYVNFRGTLYGPRLEELYKECNFAVGSLGRHRCGIRNMKALKNVEYAAHGLPFIYSENNSFFDKKNYVLKVPANESPIDINLLVRFYNNLNLKPEEIKKSINLLSWQNQVKIIIKKI